MPPLKVLAWILMVTKEPTTDTWRRRSKEDALTLGLSDCEDAVLHEAARHGRGDASATRSERDFGSGLNKTYSRLKILGKQDGMNGHVLLLSSRRKRQ